MFLCQRSWRGTHNGYSASTGDLLKHYFLLTSRFRMLCSLLALRNPCCSSGSHSQEDHRGNERLGDRHQLGMQLRGHLHAGTPLAVLGCSAVLAAPHIRTPARWLHCDARRCFRLRMYFACLQAMDSSHVSLVSLMLEKDGFTEFRSDRNISLGLNLVRASLVTLEL